MAFRRKVRPPTLVAVGIAVLAAIFSLVYGYSGNMGAMTYLTLVAIVAMAVAAFLSFRTRATDDRRL